MLEVSLCLACSPGPVRPPRPRCQALPRLALVGPRPLARVPTPGTRTARLSLAERRAESSTANSVQTSARVSRIPRSVRRCGDTAHSLGCRGHRGAGLAVHWPREPRPWAAGRPRTRVPGREDSRLPPVGDAELPSPRPGRCGALYSPRASRDTHSSMKTWPVQGRGRGRRCVGNAGLGPDPVEARGGTGPRNTAEKSLFRRAGCISELEKRKWKHLFLTTNQSFLPYDHSQKINVRVLNKPVPLAAHPCGWGTTSRKVCKDGPKKPYCGLSHRGPKPKAKGRTPRLAQPQGPSHACEARVTPIRGWGRSVGTLGFADSSTGVGPTGEHVAFRHRCSKGTFFLPLGKTPKIAVSFEELRMGERHLILFFYIVFLKKYYVSALLLRLFKIPVSRLSSCPTKTPESSAV